MLWRVCLRQPRLLLLGLRGLLMRNRFDEARVEGSAGDELIS
jgi:hypothetical protein